MEYNFREIEKKWQLAWKETGIYHVSNSTDKPKCYVLDMFPYPSGAGLHVGHPLGYIASDIFARYKRLKGFNVLHPMGFDSFGLPAEQYALETGQHPAVTTEKNIATFKNQLDKIGFCFDWSREVKTSDPEYYRWTQWIFLQLFKSWYNHETDKAEPIETLIKKFETSGSDNFSAEEWKSFDEKKKQEILMNFRLAFSSYGEVNWCEALGTVLANDEVVNGVSERGGHPVEKKKMRQWYLRITDYADRLLKGLDTVEFSDAMKEMQRNWIGRSEGAEMEFEVEIISGKLSPQAEESLTPDPSPQGEGGEKQSPESKATFRTSDFKVWPLLKDLSRENRKEKTPAEDKLWQKLRDNQFGSKVRRQHVIEGFIIDFAFLNEKLLIEVDGDYHNDPEQKEYDDSRTEYLESLGFRVLRVTNDEVINHFPKVSETIKKELAASPLSGRRGAGGEAKKSEAFSIKVYTTRPDTIFGVDFLVLAPEHELVNEITTDEQRQSIDEYLTYVKSRSDRERQSEVKQITGCFTGSYAVNPFDGKQIPIWIAEYVLAGYGTGAIMAVPCGDQRDFDFATHFNIPITNIIGKHFDGKEANPTKEAMLENSGFLNGMLMKDAIGVAINKIEELGIGKRKVNYRMRDAGFSRQRYWGEPFPIIWSDGIAIPLDEKELPLELPFVEKYGPGKEGEGPLSNLVDWVNVAVNEAKLHSDLTPNPSPKVERGAALVPKYKVSHPVQYELAKSMRKDYTKTENKLWQELRNNQLGVKFRRQHPIESYIVDFVSLQNSLIVEVDGGYHENQEQKIYDEERTKTLNEIGFQVIRFSNEDVLENISLVLKNIKETLASSTMNLVEKDKGVLEFTSPLSTRGEGLGVRETSTMPGYAGSSWYFLRYMDPHNNETFADKKATDYWNQVDVYIGGTEHAVGHLLYSRMWTKFLYDLGLISFDEPYKKLVNQGMITGISQLMYRYNPNGDSKSRYMADVIPFLGISINELIDNENNDPAFLLTHEVAPLFYFSYDAIPEGEEGNFVAIHVPIEFVDNSILNLKNFVNKVDKFSKSCFVSKSGFFYKGQWYGEDKNLIKEQIFKTSPLVEKMSKSKFNVDNPDEIIDKYGADTFRMYEMFLGPVEQSKPWDTKGIEGVHRFLKKLWRLFYDDLKGKVWNEEKPTDAEFKTLNKTIKKIEEDTERFSFNTAVSAFMVCVNELTDLKCHKKEILEPMLILLTPYAPHIAEELYHTLGNSGSVLDAEYPKLNNKYLVESEKEYPISINGKMRTTMVISLEATQQEVEKMVLENETVQKWIDSKPIKKIIFVKNKMVNVVV